MATRLADALDAPQLVRIARDGRSRSCGNPACGKPILVEGMGPRRYCDELCRRSAEIKRRGEGPVSGSAGIRILQTELLRVGPVKKQAIGKALTLLQDERGPELEEITVDRLRVHMGAVAAMCESCEPDGVCKTEDCSLRSVSPFPLLDLVDIQLARRPEPWKDHPDRQDAHVARLAARWGRQDSDERRKQSGDTLGWWARLTPEERVAQSQRIRDGQNRARAKRRSARKGRAA